MKYLYNFLLRYVLCFIPVIVFEFIFTPITIYGVYFLLKPFNPAVIGNIMTVNGIPFTFIDACIAPYAYYLIFILALSTKDLELKTRIKIIIFGFILVLAMNYFRIALLVGLTVKYGFSVFNSVHLFFWKFLSWFYVTLVWIFLVKLYKIKSIPVYSDFKYLFKQSLFRK